MSLITRCPACETLFKVVPDQLRISEGWVRCGQCDEVFDASLHLLPETPVNNTLAPVPEVPSPELEPELEWESEPAVEAPDLAQPVWHVPGDDLNPPQSLEPEVIAQEATLVVPQEFEPDAQGDEDETAVTQFLPYVSALPETTAPLSESAEPAEPAEVEPDRQADLSDVSFMRSKVSTAVERSPAWRVGLWVLSVLLLLSLMAQIIIHERDRIVSWAPALKPALQTVCSTLGCVLSPLRQIESIVIESASFTKMRSDSYRLNFIVKNTASTALAVPAVELTLTDTRDQAVVRRVFLASEIGVKWRELAAGSEWPASIAMEVKGAGASEPVAGYRIVAFYP